MSTEILQEYIDQARYLTGIINESEVTATAFALLITVLLEREKNPNMKLVIMDQNQQTIRELHIKDLEWKNII